VSVVTPFYNTREYLAECIESVLRQSHPNWEYILVDNCSTDGSSEIAERYASKCPEKIRVVRTESFLSQVANYNFALTRISPGSKYCKIVQADDWLFPDCVEKMVELADAHPAVGIVAAYELEGNDVLLDGLPYPSPEVSGREICRLYFLKDMYLFGTATSLLIRSDIVRSRQPFYEERRVPVEDADACFSVLKTWSFGFVHQVLTYTRRGNESIVSRIGPYNPWLLGRLTNLVVHGRDSLSEEEFKKCLSSAEKYYFVYLSKSALRFRSREFWDLHRRGLASINYSLDWWLLGKWMPRAVLELTWNAFWLTWDRLFH
jgi:glycosyltransferase involved in cell wall biosynthesis